MLFLRVIFFILFACVVMAIKQGGKCRSSNQCECRSPRNYHKICEDHTCRCYPRYNNPSYHFKKDQFCTSSVECECPHDQTYSHKCLNNTCKCTPINGAPSDPTQSGLSCGRRGYCNCPHGHKAGCINEHCMCASNLPVLFCTKIEDCECPEGNSKECIGNQCMCSPPPLDNTPSNDATKGQSCTEISQCQCTEGLFAECISNECKCSPASNSPSDNSQENNDDSISSQGVASNIIVFRQCTEISQCTCPNDHFVGCIDNQCKCSPASNFPSDNPQITKTDSIRSQATNLDSTNTQENNTGPTPSPGNNTEASNPQVDNTVSINLSQLANVLRQIKDFFSKLQIPQI